MFNNLKFDCLIKIILLLLSGASCIVFGGSLYGKKQNNVAIVPIVVGFVLLVWAYYTYKDKKCYMECESEIWSSRTLIVPSDFKPDQEKVSICYAQKWAQQNSIYGFIACLSDNAKSDAYDVMYLDGASFKGTETACTDCKIYFTENFRVTLEPESTENEKEKPTTGCPMNPYPYCSANDVDTVYVNMGCHASTSLIKKLIDEEKLDGPDDPRIVKCCETPEVCRANQIRAFPTVKCKNNVTIQGFCP